MSGGMQTSPIRTMYCECGKATSKTIDLGVKRISIHFTKNSVYWHVVTGGMVKRVFKQPDGWDA